jgi:cytochrome c2
LAAHAAFNQAYFRKYVREPRSVMPGAKMEAHPHYTDTQLDELIAFITADGK